MAKVERFYIVGKDGKWLKSSRPDVIEIPYSNLFSIYVNDAKRFEERPERKRAAKKLARRVGGDVWLFCPATCSKELIWTRPPEYARCDNCQTYAGYDGECKNPESEFYRTPVSIEDVCDEWRERKDGRKG